MGNIASGVLSAVAVAVLAHAAAAQDQVTRYVRYALEGRVSYGILEGETIVRLLAPVEPSKVIAVGLNCPRAHVSHHDKAVDEV